MNSLQSLADKLDAQRDQIESFLVVTGFDGFVDEMIQAVDLRHDINRYQAVKTIDQFGSLIKAAAGHSSLREIVVTQTDPGGCAINMGDGLAALGVQVDTFATVGEPVHAAFQEYASKATLHSWGREPGRTLAFEFNDGKLMFSAVSPLSEFTPQDIQQRIQDGVFLAKCETADLIAITDWTLFPHMTACWKALQDHVFSKLSHRPKFFLDLVDPVSRSPEDIAAMLKALPGFCQTGHTTLGLNQNEANLLSKATGGEALPKPDISRAKDQAQTLLKALCVDEVVIHAVDYAVSASAQGTAETTGPYCADPVKLTGAGDRFNAGYALGMLLELPPTQQLQLAVFTSGIYVRQGTSATLEQVIQFIRSTNDEA
ncbi:PfkB family carbohydrate kinase [Coraliomargarita sp. SDUM461003]|uniref:PfkB family carbohydrate kinase n=1 Tax=Thalassobacterium maritimum TaxID=3041265 RepID=A0ABU1AW42_9BACT|nr:PfkB family carbohydrate kinase [Coraliomargarita sp. SDUM461003]MDQ8208358.1 PfkB family carbohydrate kinase [Coraliomargarita sp. SDUM461003]